MKLNPQATAVVAIDMHRGHLDPAVATLPLPAERCGPVIARAAQLFRELRAIAVPIVHVVTEYRDSGEIAANPFWNAIDADPNKVRKGILRHNLAGGPGAPGIPALWAEGGRRVTGKKRYKCFPAPDPQVFLPR